MDCTVELKTDGAMSPTTTQQSALIESCAPPANTNPIRVGSWIGWGRIILGNLNIRICMMSLVNYLCFMHLVRTRMIKQAWAESRSLMSVNMYHLQIIINVLTYACCEFTTNRLFSWVERQFIISESMCHPQPMLSEYVGLAFICTMKTLLVKVMQEH